MQVSTTMIKWTIFVLFILTASGSIVNDHSWLKWKSKYNKQYTVEDEFHRHQIWEENRDRMEAHNKRYAAGLETYKMGLNHFSDLTWDEFRARYLRTNMVFNKTKSTLHNVQKQQHSNVPESIDWRDYGFVTSVKNQGECGSCYAFSAVGALEAQLKWSRGNVTDLSPQEIVDCSFTYGNFGCGGGYMDNAFRFVQDFGIEVEPSYPYTATVGQCSADQAKAVLRTKSIIKIQPGDEADLEQKVASYGPIAVAINTPSSFVQYSSGIYDGADCYPDYLTHAVLLVGYGKEAAGDYWLVKNSWSTEWGESGYIKMRKFHNNICGIANLASFPQV